MAVRGMVDTGWRKLTVLALALVALGLGILGQHQFVDEQNEAAGVLLWLGALAAFCGALWQARRTKQAVAGQSAAAPKEEPLSLRVEGLLFTAVLAVGVFFRFYRIGEIPSGLNNDAARNGLGALNLTPVVSYFTEPYFISGFGLTGWGKETLFLQLITVFQPFLDAEFAIELASITAGIATLVAVYFLVRRLFEPQLALIATLLISVSGWHITFSRVGWRSILLPLAAALLFYFLVRAVQEHRLRHFIIAGVLLGFSLDTYNAARILPVIVVGYLAYEAIRSEDLLRTDLVKIGVFVAASLAAFAPLGWYVVNNWSVYNSRAGSVWVGAQIEQAGSAEPLFANLKDTLLLFNFQAGGSDFFVWEPLLDVPVAVFFPFGLVLALSRWRERGYFLLLLTLLLSLAVGIASQPEGNRVLLAIIPVVVFAASFLVTAWRWLQQAFPSYRLLFSLGLVAVLLYTSYLTYDSYLGPNRRSQHGYSPEATRVGRYVDGIASDYQVIVVAGMWPLAPIEYLTLQDGGPPFRRADVADLRDLRPSPGQSTAIIVEATTEDLIIGYPRSPGINREVRESLREAYPEAEVDLIYYPDDSDTVAAYAFLFPEGASIARAPDVSDGAAARDTQRQNDLRDIAAVLDDYRERTGTYPATGGEVQAGCVFDGIDAMCVLAPLLGDTLIDPSGDAAYGYWYWSDGATFTLFALFERQLDPNEQCITTESAFVGRDDIYCLHIE